MYVLCVCVLSFDASIDSTITRYKNCYTSLGKTSNHIVLVLLCSNVLFDLSDIFFFALLLSISDVLHPLRLFFCSETKLGRS